MGGLTQKQSLDKGKFTCYCLCIALARVKGGLGDKIQNVETSAALDWASLVALAAFVVAEIKSSFVL